MFFTREYLSILLLVVSVFNIFYTGWFQDEDFDLIDILQFFTKKNQIKILIYYQTPFSF